MNKFRKKPKEMKVEVVGIAVIGKQKPAEGTKETNQEIPDCESIVANTSEIINSMNKIIELGKTVKTAKAAYKNAIERIGKLKEEMELLREESLKADDEVKTASGEIIRLQSFLKEKGMKI